MADELRLLGVPANCLNHLQDLVLKKNWRVQPVLPGQFQAYVELKDGYDTAKLASRLFKLGNIHFEIEQLPEQGIGERILHVPGIGMRRQLIDELGRVLIPENELEIFAKKVSENPSKNALLYRELMGFAHQDRLDQLRINTDDVSLITKVG